MAKTNDFDNVGSANDATDGAAPMLVTANQVCAMLQISLRTLWRMRSGRLLPTPVRLGSSVRWRRDEIQKWIEAGCPAEADCEK